MAGSLNAHIIKVMIALALFSFAVMSLGICVYLVLYDWFFPNADYDAGWTSLDFVTLGAILATILAGACIIGWRLAQNIAGPLKTVAGAARLITQGDFSARATLNRKAFDEAERLLADFNAMAARLQSAEAELKYSNSAIAHELRNPLTILRGRLQGLKDGAFEPSQELYSRLLAHVEDLARLVEDMRTLAMMTAGKLELKTEEGDLAIEADLAVALVEQDLQEAGIAIERNLVSAATKLDRGKVRQALLALLDNARRYAPASKLSIRTGVVDNEVFVRVGDTGPGLPLSGRDRAFERFWRADDSRTRLSGGSGLGLSVVRAIAIAHGGDAFIVPGGDGDVGLAVEIRLPSVI